MLEGLECFFYCTSGLRVIFGMRFPDYTVGACSEFFCYCEFVKDVLIDFVVIAH